MYLPAARHHDRDLFVVTGAAVFTVILWTICRPWDIGEGFFIGGLVGRDFANFWLGSRLALEGRFDLLIDFRGYNDLFSRVFQHNPYELFVYSYPPHSLLLTVPFATLPFVPAGLLWAAVNLLCVERAVRLLSPDWRLSLAACLSPAALLVVIFGHFGGIVALLATYILVRGERHPLLGGICLALISMKPQLATVFGLLLILTGRWRIVAWAIPATLVLVALSVAAFGVAPWINFIEWTIPFHMKLVANFQFSGLRTVISVYAFLRDIGMPGWLAYMIHGAFAIVVMAKAVQLLNRDGANARTIALGLLAAMTALPYIGAYDLVIAAPAMAVVLFDERSAGPRVLPVWAALPLWLVPLFAIPCGLFGLPVDQPILAIALLLALFRDDLPHRLVACRSSDSSAPLGHPPATGGGAAPEASFNQKSLA